MTRIIITILFLGLSTITVAQTIGEDVQETIPAFGHCIMPDNRTFLALEADYDGMYITERELIDLFETSRFDYSKDLVNWTYYSYWALNERTLEQPENYSFYQMIVDPTGTYLAIAKEKRGGWDTAIKIFEKNTQTKIAEFNVNTENENLDFLNQVRFDKEGKQLILGGNDQGIYSFTIQKKEISVLYPPYKYMFYDYDYENGKPILKEYIKDEEGEYFLDVDLFTLQELEKKSVSLPLPLHYTRILSPTTTHKYYGLFYEQEYDTYLAPLDDYNYQIVYHNKNTFVFITREVPKE
jgi:hypothetical protein